MIINVRNKKDLTKNKNMKSAHFKTNKGFTLIELLVVIGILAVLLAITLIAINPARQFAQANDTQRSSDVNAILNAVWQYGVQESGDLSGLALPVSPAAAAVIGTGVGQINLCPNVAPTFIAQLPVDPQDGVWGTVDTDSDGCPDEYNTDYTIVQTATAEGGRVTVCATSEVTGDPICVTR